MLFYPSIDPVAFHLGPLAIRWYGLAYVAGILLGWRWGVFLIRRCFSSTHASAQWSDGGHSEDPQVSKNQSGPGNGYICEKLFSDYIPLAALAIVMGGRLGHVLFYQLEYYMYHPLEILYIWQPGMSFHGGILGVVILSYFYCRQYKLAFKPFLDLLSVVAPIGLCFGRIANFINGELVGRPADVPWAMIFPGTDGVPRHPSQLYEAFLEGVFLFAVLNFVYIKKAWFKHYPGATAGLFSLGYGLVRSAVETVRTPEVPLDGPFTVGQLYCVPMILVGAWLLRQGLGTSPLKKPLL